jgi:hypothetical protein
VIRSLRVRHRLLVPALFALVAAGAAFALASRTEPAVMDVLPPTLIDVGTPP